MTELVVGVQHIRDEVEALPASSAELSAVGAVGTAPNASAMVFPLNVPVYMISSNETMRALLGTVGTLPDAIRGVAGQLTNGLSAARMVIVRVAEGANAQETIANILGSEALGTGIWALLDAPNDLSVTPRLILTPGYTSQFHWRGVISVPVTSGGTGYTVAPTLAFSGGGGGTGATAHAVVAGGAVTEIIIDNPGEGYTAVPTITPTGGGTGLVLGSPVVGSVANPIVAGINTVLERLDAQFFPDGPVGNRERWLAYRETIQSDRINHPMFVDVVVTDAAGNYVTRPASPRVVGAYVATDQEHGGRPFHSPSNRPIYDIVGVSPPVPFSYRDPNTLGQEILGANGGIIVKGETGVEASVADGGFVFWGTDNCGENDNWRMTNVMRGRDYIELTQLNTLKYFLGRYRIITAVVFAVIDTMRKHLQWLKDNEDILDFRTGIEPGKNPVEQLRIGNLAIMFRAEEAPVLKKLTIYSRRMPSALDTLIANVATQLGNAA